MNLLVLLSQLFTSGQTTHVVSLAETFQRMGHQVDMAVATSNFRQPVASKYLEHLKAVGGNIIAVNDTEETIAIAQQRPYTVVHAHSSKDFKTALAIKEACGLPYVLTCHGLGVAGCKYAPCFAQASHIICVGPRIGESLKKHASKITVIQNTVDLEKFYPGPKPSVFTILYAGRVDRHKEPGLSALLRATRRLMGRYKLRIAGNLWAGEFAGGQDEFLGWVPDIEKPMRTAHVVVGTGRAIREGMAAGCACLILGWSYDGLVTPEMLSNGAFPDFSGQRNYPAPPKVEDIKRDLLRLHKDEAFLQSLQQFGHSYALDNFDQSRVAQTLLDIYAASAEKEKPLSV